MRPWAHVVSASGTYDQTMRRSKALLAIALTAVLTTGLVSLGGQSGPTASPQAAVRAAARPTPSAPRAAGPTPTRTRQPRQVLVPWHGPVEHLFFHPVVLAPALAFTSDRLGKNFRDYFVTVGELRAILDQLDRKGWTLVDIHRVADGTVRVPPGRTPLVLSEDDVNYYDYMRQHGLAWRLALDKAGNVEAEVHDAHGVHLTREDLVPMLDDLVVAHPEFSADGAKAILAPTGFQGLLGERTQNGDPGALTRARAVARRLTATGWTFASHSYGHIDMRKASLPVATRDTERWLAEATPVLGRTDVYVYPFGAEPPLSSPVVAMLRAHGFRILCDIDAVPRLTRSHGVVLMARRHIDGLAFDVPGHLRALFDVSTVEDRRARGLT